MHKTRESIDAQQKAFIEQQLDAQPSGFELTTYAIQIRPKKAHTETQLYHWDFPNNKPKS